MYLVFDDIIIIVIIFNKSVLKWLMIDDFFFNWSIVFMGLTVAVLELCIGIFAVPNLIKYHDRKDKCADLWEIGLIVCISNFLCSVTTISFIIYSRLNRETAETMMETYPLFVRDQSVVTDHITKSKLKRLTIFNFTQIIVILANVWTCITYFQMGSACEIIWMSMATELLILFYLNFYLNWICVLLFCSSIISYVHMSRLTSSTQL